MIIRHAALEDVPALVALGRDMHDESPRFRGLPYDETQVTYVGRNLIENEDGLVLVAEHDGQLAGMLAGVAVQHFFCAEFYATDLVFYVVPEHRGSSAAFRLLAQWRTHWRSRGVTELVLGVSTEVHPERTMRLYERLGYRRSGGIMVSRS